MSWKILGLGLAVILAVLLAAIFVGYMKKDEVELRYETMAVEVEDRCKLLSSSDKCKEYSRCYRDGIEAAYPRDAMREYAFKNRKAPSEIEQAHTALQRKCLSEAGVKVGG